MQNHRKKHSGTRQPRLPIDNLRPSHGSHDEFAFQFIVGLCIRPGKAHFGSHAERSEPWSFQDRTDAHASQKALSVATQISNPPKLTHHSIHNALLAKIELHLGYFEN